jgi:ethanolamine transporter EutH
VDSLFDSVTLNELPFRQIVENVRPPILYCTIVNYGLRMQVTPLIGGFLVVYFRKSDVRRKRD